ncbi:hypothetical protein PVK06_011703 [Gossypium arboreum]|uniref:Retrotransposon gag domain-containing protein n=1 Tax=Gossypium arboreum TaxID=29729 RepID=A0ABR0QAG6_GOSAR|nr:hypothetical protein PVK06_011703 [Gossypium arboreum]
MMEMMSALVKGKGPMQSPDIEEPQSRVNHSQDPLYPPGFTPPHAHATQRGYTKGEPTDLEQRAGASPADPLVPDLDDPAKIAKLKTVDHEPQEKYRSLEERLKAMEGTEAFSALNAKELSWVPNLVLPLKFKDSLVGSTLRWYNQLSREKIRSWKDLASALCEQYKHVSDMVPDRMTLQMMEKKPSETFRQYAQRWRDVSVQVEPPLIKTEITVLFISTLKAPFYDKLVGSATKDFTDIVISGELIENAVKSGRMEGQESSRREAPMKKKEPEVHMVGMGSCYAPNPYPNQPRPQNYHPSNFYYPPQTSYYQAPPPSYPLISPHYMAPLKPPYPKWYDPNASCAYHAGNQGHSTENCLPFKRRVQGLIDAGILRFHGTGGHDIQSCEEFKRVLQNMMDNKEIEIFYKGEEADGGEICASDHQSSGFPYSSDRPLIIYYDAKKEPVKPKLIIEVPSPFPYKDNKAIPWKYDVNIVTPEDGKPKAMTGSVEEVDHFTRSGRYYSKEVKPVKENSDLKQKGKAPIRVTEDEHETVPEQEAKKPMDEEEAQEFLKFIKHSEYNVVEQLSKQPARISILSLLLNSEPHRNALLKVLNQTYVANNISVEKLDRWVNNLNAGKQNSRAKTVKKYQDGYQDDCGKRGPSKERFGKVSARNSQGLKAGTSQSSIRFRVPTRYASKKKIVEEGSGEKNCENFGPRNKFGAHNLPSFVKNIYICRDDITRTG